jgi:hypothetical protein
LHRSKFVGSPIRAQVGKRWSNEVCWPACRRTARRRVAMRLTLLKTLVLRFAAGWIRDRAHLAAREKPAHLSLRGCKSVESLQISAVVADRTRAIEGLQRKNRGMCRNSQSAPRKDCHWVPALLRPESASMPTHGLGCHSSSDGRPFDPDRVFESTSPHGYKTFCPRGRWTHYAVARWQQECRFRTR